MTWKALRIQARRGSFWFQGPYTTNGHLTRYGFQQLRTFLSFSPQYRTREYCMRRILGYTMEQMYDVVSDVGNYYKFLPCCKKSIVLAQTPATLEADLVIGIPPIKESYTSRVSLIKPRLVKAEAADGTMFHHLLTLWKFSPGLQKEERSCVVDFNIKFEVNSPLHSPITNYFFDNLARQMEDSFIKEVERRYGPPAIPPKQKILMKQVFRIDENCYKKSLVGFYFNCILFVAITYYMLICL